ARPAMLKDQKIVVVGASGALGGHFLTRATELGANCVAVSRTRMPGHKRAYQCDVRNLDEVATAAEDISRELGAIDTLLNFTGTHHAPMDFFKDDPEKLLGEFLIVIDVNLT